jgi:hypothetical protein
MLRSPTPTPRESGRGSLGLNWNGSCRMARSPLQTLTWQGGDALYSAHTTARVTRIPLQTRQLSVCRIRRFRVAILEQFADGSENSSP